MGVKIENKLIVRKNKSSYSTPLDEVIKELNEFNEENGTNISYGKYVGFKAKGWLYMLKKKKTLEDEAAYKGYEKNLITLTGTKVEIQRKDNNKGKIVIDYNSLEEFEKIYEIILKGGKQ